MMRLCAYLLIASIGAINAGPIELHNHPEVAIVGYTGPLHKGVMQLMRGAEIIEIIDSDITSMEGHMVSELPKLRVFRFKNCTIDVDKVDVENMLHGAVNLREFHASNIKAKTLRPEIIRTLPIEIFELTDNTYPVFPSNLLNETNLKKLKLHRNHLEKIEDGAFNGLHSLEILDLETNDLKELTKLTLTPLKSVKIIKLRENKVEKFAADNLPELPNLEILDLGYNPLKELSLEGIEKVAPKLKTIDIAGTQLGDARLKELEGKYTTIKFDKQ